MTISLSTPITGSAQTGFTAPTYTLTADYAPDVNNGKQWAVTALGGTQAGVTVHSGSSVFTVMFSRPKVFRVLGKPNPTTGVLKDVPVNIYKFNVRKGVTPLANQPYATAMVRGEVHVPAGSDTYDAANLRAMISVLGGALSQISAGMGDTIVSGLI